MRHFKISCQCSVQEFSRLELRGNDLKKELDMSPFYNHSKKLYVANPVFSESFSAEDVNGGIVAVH